MFVEDLQKRLRELLQLAKMQGNTSTSDSLLHQFSDTLEPIKKLAHDKFLNQMAKIKVPKESSRKPRKSTKQIEQERIAKELAKLEKLKLAEIAAEKKAQEKLQADQEKKTRKEEEQRQKSLMAGKAVRDSIQELQALLHRFRSGNVPQDAVDRPLEKLKGFKATELFEIAQALNAATTLTVKTTKAKILKLITELIRRVWKTSDNVNH